MAIASLQRCISPDGFKRLRCDFLEDVESIYYVVFVVMTTQMATGVTIHPPLKLTYQEWLNKNASFVILAKGSHFERREFKKVMLEVPKWWAPSAVEALGEFFKIVKPIVSAKGEAQGLESDEQIEEYEDFLEKEGTTAFDRMLAVLDIALKKESMGTFDPTLSTSNLGTRRSFNEGLPSPSTTTYSRPSPPVHAPKASSSSSTHAPGDESEDGGEDFKMSSSKRTARNFDRDLEPESPLRMREKRVRDLASFAGPSRPRRV